MGNSRKIKKIFIGVLLIEIIFIQFNKSFYPMITFPVFEDVTSVKVDSKTFSEEFRKLNTLEKTKPYDKRYYITYYRLGLEVNKKESILLFLKNQ